MACSSRIIVGLALTICLLGVASPAAADGTLQASHGPRGRSCCAFAAKIPLHLGATHVPIQIGLTGSAAALGEHSYIGYDKLDEYLALIYTKRGGFIDLGHTRDYADIASWFAVRLRPMLAEGTGLLSLEPLESSRRVRILAKVPPELLDDVVAKIARRAAFEVSVWTEVVQYYASGKTPGATEVYSSFTPDDLYSNVLGTYLGVRAVESPEPYDRAMDRELAAALASLGAVSHEETNRVLNALEGKWWSAAAAWPSADIAIARWIQTGPEVPPLRPPPEIAPDLPPPMILQVPETDARGTPLSHYYQTEFLPEPKDFARYAYAGSSSWVTGADLPRIAEGILRTSEAARETRTRIGPPPVDELEKSALTHYMNGIRLVQLDAQGGVLGGPLDRNPRGAGGGSLTGVAADTRSGDFAFARFDLGGSAERGLIAGFSLFRTSAVWFCHDPETDRMRAPLVSLLGPCRGGELLGIGGNVFEGLHDGRTGRTALRPIALWGVLNPLRNGQSPSYERMRILLRAGGDVEHFWTEAEHATTVGRVGGGAVLLARSPSGRFEASGASHYLIAPGDTEDAVLQTHAALRYNFLLSNHPAKGSAESVDPWGVASLGIVGAHAYASRPLHAFPDAEAPFISAEHRSTWQFLLTASVGFEGLAF